MKKNILFITFVSLFVCCGLLESGERSFFVSPDVQDGGDGSKGKPFKSLIQARDSIRNLRKNGSLKSNEAVTVYLSPGVYNLDAAFELTSEDSGFKGAPVIYKAQKNNTAHFYGGTVIPPGEFQYLIDLFLKPEEKC